MKESTYIHNGCVNMLPQSIVLKLPKTSILLIDIMVDMIYRNMKRSGRQRGYITPSEEWLSKRTCRSRSWISQNIKLLESLKIIKVIRRRKVHGRWSTNLYTLGSVLRNRALNIIESGKKFLKSLMNKDFHRVKSSEHIVIPNINSINKKAEESSFNHPEIGINKRIVPNLLDLESNHLELKKYLEELSIKYGLKKQSLKTT